MAWWHPILELDTGQFTHRGQKRPNNEDWLGSFQPDDERRLLQKGSLFLVADGMGGHQSGDVASRRAVDHVIRSYMTQPSADVPFSLRQAIESANRLLYHEMGHQAREPAGTTLVAAVIRNDDLWIANVGDSRAYLFRAGTLRQLSRDHSLSFGELRADRSAEPLGSNLVTRALGLKPSVEVDLFPPIELQLGDRVLLCTDGLTKPLSDQDILTLIDRYPPQKTAEALVKAANDRGGPDNITALLVEVTGQQNASGWRAPIYWLEGLVQAPWQRVSGARSASSQQPKNIALLVGAALLIALALIALGAALYLVLR